MAVNRDPDGTRIQEYVNAKYKVHYTPARLSSGKWYRQTEEGNWIPEQEFLAANPVVFRQRINSLENADKKSAALK